MLWGTDIRQTSKLAHLIIFHCFLNSITSSCVNKKSIAAVIIQGDLATHAMLPCISLSYFTRLAM